MKEKNKKWIYVLPALAALYFIFEYGNLLLSGDDSFRRIFSFCAWVFIALISVIMFIKSLKKEKENNNSSVS